MARIPDQELERLKVEVDLAALVAAKGIELRRHGRDLVGLCPFHDDRDPSLIVTPDKNLWHCLGACRKGGSVIDWVMAAEGVSFRHAVEILRADNPLITAAAPVERSSVKRLPTPIRVDAADHELLAEVVDYYHSALKDSTEALAYLHRRGIGDELIDTFKLGFANRTLGYRLPDKNRSLGATVRGRLQRLGVYRSSGHEHFNGSLVIPVFDSRGRVVELYGRKITKSLRKERPTTSISRAGTKACSTSTR